MARAAANTAHTNPMQGGGDMFGSDQNAAMRKLVENANRRMKMLLNYTIAALGVMVIISLYAIATHPMAPKLQTAVTTVASLTP